MIRIKRKVISVRNYIDPHANGTKGTNVLTLECNHTTSRKGSVTIPEFVYCQDCGDWANGKTISSSEGDVVETWDTEKQMPVFTKLEAPTTNNS